MNSTENIERSGFVALIGRPNCGKSTLMNTILGEELAVVTTLPQTTRKNLKGIYTGKGLQIVFVDTPGIHAGRQRFNKSMVEEGSGLLRKHNVDVVCYIVDCARSFGEEEDMVARMVKESGIPCVVIFNKEDLCPAIDGVIGSFYKRYPEFISKVNCKLSAVSKKAKDIFINVITPLMPEGPMLFPADDLTDADMRFFAAEYIRKHIINSTRDEVPHAVYVEIISYRETEDMHYIDAEIHVETDGQKAIIIGKKGSLVRKIQEDAAADVQKLSGVRAIVKCHVKISPDWRSNDRFLHDMGFIVR
jgi:GTP-binding protein Era